VVVALTAFTVTPDPLTRNGIHVQSPGRKITAELADVFESPFATHEDFLDPSEQELNRLHAMPGEIDEFLEQALEEMELVYA
jgi:hypothetical protein